MLFRSRHIKPLAFVSAEVEQGAAVAGFASRPGRHGHAEHVAGGPDRRRKALAVRGARSSRPLGTPFGDVEPSFDGWHLGYVLVGALRGALFERRPSRVEPRKGLRPANPWDARASAALVPARELGALVRRGLRPGPVQQGRHGVLGSKLPLLRAGRRRGKPGSLDRSATRFASKPFARWLGPRTAPPRFVGVPDQGAAAGRAKLECVQVVLVGQRKVTEAEGRLGMRAQAPDSRRETSGPTGTSKACETLPRRELRSDRGRRGE